MFHITIDYSCFILSNESTCFSTRLSLSRMTHLTASLLDDLMISLAVGTPTRLNVMPWINTSVGKHLKYNHTGCTSTVQCFISAAQTTKTLTKFKRDTYGFVFYIAQLVLFFPLVKTDADSSSAGSARTS